MQYIFYEIYIMQPKSIFILKHKYSAQEKKLKCSPKHLRYKIHTNTITLPDQNLTVCQNSFKLPNKISPRFFALSPNKPKNIQCLRVLDTNPEPEIKLFLEAKLILILCALRVYIGCVNSKYSFLNVLLSVYVSGL